MHANVVSMDDYRLKTGRHLCSNTKHDYDQILYKRLRDLPIEAIQGAQYHFRNNFNAGCDPETCMGITERTWRMRSRRGGFDPQQSA